MLEESQRRARFQETPPTNPRIKVQGSLFRSMMSQERYVVSEQAEFFGRHVDGGMPNRRNYRGSR